MPAMLYIYDNWFLGPIILWSLLTIVIASCLIRNSKYRSLVVYTAIMPVIFELVWAILNLVLAQSFKKLYYSDITELMPIVNAFNLLRPSFVPLPGLVACLRMSRQIGIKRAPWLAYLGFFYVVLLIIVNIIFVLVENDLDRLAEFVIRGHCGFIGVFALYLAMFWKKLYGKAKITLIVYTSVYIISEIFFLVVDLNTFYTYAWIIVSFVLVDFMSALSILITVLCGHLWTTDNFSSEVNSNGKFEVDDNDNDGQVDFDATDSFLPVYNN